MIHASIGRERDTLGHRQLPRGTVMPPSCAPSRGRHWSILLTHENFTLAESVLGEGGASDQHRPPRRINSARRPCVGVLDAGQCACQILGGTTRPRRWLGVGRSQLFFSVGVAALGVPTRLDHRVVRFCRVALIFLRGAHRPHR
jgi:hypothetical protein